MEPIKYRKVGDFLLPEVPEEKEQEKPTLSYFGNRRLKYLREKLPIKYVSLLESGRLWTHLQEVDERAWEFSDRYVKEMMEKNQVSDELKDTDTLAWVRYVNQFKQEAEEIINRDMIYSPSI